jgi:P27 family predicted phage terminase small subunit
VRGRKPLPTIIKKTKGTLQKCRTNKREPKPQTLLGDPPAQLTEGAKDAWRLAIACAPQGLLTGLDANILAAWAAAADLFWRAQEGLAKTGLLIKSPSGFPVQSPYLAIINKQAQLMSRAAAEMGFTPASRARVALAGEAKDELDPWDEIAG